jgi:uncharacterized damage-inducible protein DinB
MLFYLSALAFLRYNRPPLGPFSPDPRLKVPVPTIMGNPLKVTSLTCPSTGGASMSIAKGLLPEFDQEMATTRKLLERVPSDKAPWKPHPKSFPLGYLAQLVVTMLGWLTQTLLDTEINLATSSLGYSFETTDTLLGEFDRHVLEAREALTSAKDADFTVLWSLKNGNQVLFTAPRGAVVRSHLNHLIHHRGQLSVYLRLNDVPLPSMYGPTADEPW